MTDPDTFLCDRLRVEIDGEELTVWNSLTVTQHHEVRATEVVSTHSILAGDGSTGEEPEYITPEMDEQLREVNVYPAATVIDPRADHVTIL